jgi:hypothetical protein
MGLPLGFGSTKVGPCGAAGHHLGEFLLRPHVLHDTVYPATMLFSFCSQTATAAPRTKPCMLRWRSSAQWMSQQAPVAPTLQRESLRTCLPSTPTTATVVCRMARRMRLHRVLTRARPRWSSWRGRPPLWRRAGWRRAARGSRRGMRPRATFTTTMRRRSRRG